MACRSHPTSVLFAAYKMWRYDERLKDEITDRKEQNIKHLLRVSFDTNEMNKDKNALCLCASWWQKQCVTSRCGKNRDHYLSMPSPSLLWQTGVSWRDPMDCLYQSLPGKHRHIKKHIRVMDCVEIKIIVLGHSHLSGFSSDLCDLYKCTKAHAL